MFTFDWLMTTVDLLLMNKLIKSCWLLVAYIYPGMEGNNLVRLVGQQEQSNHPERAGSRSLCLKLLVTCMALV